MNEEKEIKKLRTRVAALETGFEEMKTRNAMNSNTGEKLTAVKDWLKGYLDGEPALISEVQEEATNMGIGKLILKRAKNEMGVESYRQEGAWFCRL